VLELCEKGPLSGLLRTARDAGQDAIAFGVPQLLVYAGGAAAGMVYMAGLGFVHRDLAARNVLVDGKDNAKIADFGLAREQNYGAYDAVTVRPLPLKWMSPEAIEYARFTTASDVWSFAVLVWEVMSMAAIPYTTIRNAGLCQALQIDGYRLPAPEGCPAQIYELLLECWNLEASGRPSFAQIETRLRASKFELSLAPASPPQQPTDATAPVVFDGSEADYAADVDGHHEVQQEVDYDCGEVGAKAVAGTYDESLAVDHTYDHSVVALAGGHGDGELSAVINGGYIGESLVTQASEFTTSAGYEIPVDETPTHTDGPIIVQASDIYVLQGSGFRARAESSC